jgi:hypothetical protein
MTLPGNPQITDELLSAYLDGVVSAEEKVLIEAAVATEPGIAWRLETLRQTVQLLRTLPEVALPRSFALSEASLAVGQDGVAALQSAPVMHPRIDIPQPATRWRALLEAWRAFWQMGSPMLRNAAAVSFALFLVLTVGDFGFDNVLSKPRAANRPTLAVSISTPVQAASVERAEGAEPAPAAAELASAPSTAPAPTISAKQSSEGVAAVTAESPASVSSNESFSMSAQAGRDSDAPGAASGLAAPSGPGLDGPSSFLRDEEAEAAQEPMVATSLSTALATVEQSTSQPLTATSQMTMGYEQTVTSAAVHPPAQPQEAQNEGTATDAPMVAEKGTSAEGQPTSAATAPPTATTVAPQSNAAGSNTLPTEDARPTATGNRAPAPPAGAGSNTPVAVQPFSLLLLAQLLVGLLTLLFAALWWRSRSRVVA